VPGDLAESALSLLCSDAALGLDRAVDATPARFGAIARTWVLCTEDRIVTPALQRRLIAELDVFSSGSPTGARTRVVELSSSHSPFLSRPRELAGLIADAADG
jgi:hypothetical protein